MADLTPEQQAVLEAVTDTEAMVRAVVSGRQRNAEVPFRRLELRYVDLTAGRHLQVVSYDERQAYTRNVPVHEAPAEAQQLLLAGYASWHVETTTETVQLRVSKKGKHLLARNRHKPGEAPAPDRSHDRSKQRRLEADDALFRVLGVSDADGRLKPRRTAKFRQVQDMLAAIDPLVDDAARRARAEHRPLRMVDLGCGNAYLTFGAYRYLTAVKGLEVAATGVDVKAQARAHNSDVAAELGFGDRFTFTEATIDGADVRDTPDLVLALHACDTATDAALARAVRWQAPVVVAAPCCHHDLQRQLTSATVPDAFALMTRHGILRERMADVLTDALRAAVLRLCGYRTEVVEFVDSRHTPRNALIRAVCTGAPADPGVRAGFVETLRAWQVRPALVDMLGDDAPDVVAAADEAVRRNGAA